MRRRAFTLIELLVVIGIMVLLASMAMPMLGTARRSAQRTNTASLLHKIDAGCRLFHRDVGVFPYQRAYVAAVGGSTPSLNNLARRLAHRLSGTELQELRDLNTVAVGRYASFGDFSGDGTETTFGSPLTFRQSYLPPDADMATVGGGNVSHNKAVFSAMLNRMGGDRARMAVAAGGFDLSGGIISGANSGGVVFKDLSNDRLLTAAEIGSVAGWCDDYLAGEIDTRSIQGDALVDLHGQPVVYVGQVVPRIRNTATRINGHDQDSVETIWFGLGTTGFTSRTGPWDTLVTAQRLFLLGLGRVRLSASDAGDGQPTPTDPTFFPDAAALMVSDRRYYSGRLGQIEFELWSAGPDARLEWRRSDPANRDNVSAAPYDRDIQ